MHRFKSWFNGFQRCLLFDRIQKWPCILHRGRKIISMLKEETLTSIISAISESVFYIFVPIKTLPTLALQISRSQQINKVETQLWDILYVCRCITISTPQCQCTPYIYNYLCESWRGYISISARAVLWSQAPIKIGSAAAKSRGWQRAVTSWCADNTCRAIASWLRYL